MSLERHREAAAAESLGFATLVVSDARTAASDRSGPLVAERVAAAGHRAVERRLAANQVEAVRRELGALLADERVDVVVVCGGTGLASRDVTVEAVRPLLARELPGFGELFRALSFQEIGAAAMLSRATAGVASGRAVFVLPGSPPAVALALDRLILPEAAHLLEQVRS